MPTTETAEAQQVMVAALESIHRELDGIYQRFAVVVATGHEYAESMGHVIKGIAGLWEVLAGVVDVASWLDEVGQTPDKGWELLDQVEYHMRRCLMLKGRSIEHASMLLRVLGVMIGDADRCAAIWRTWSPAPVA